MGSCDLPICSFFIDVLFFGLIYLLLLLEIYLYFEEDNFISRLEKLYVVEFSSSFLDPQSDQLKINDFKEI